MTINTEEIKSQVIEQLKWDSRIDTSKVRIDVSDGRIILRGKVPTCTARRRAEMDALTVPGAMSVDNQLVVEPPPNFHIPDEELGCRIDNLFQWSSEIGPADIRVSIKDGQVTLEGAVDAYWKKLKAEELIAALSGIRAIKNALAVVPSKDLVDRAIADNIIAALERNQSIDVNTINVRVEDHRVTLSGTVPNESVRRAVLNVARYASGIVDIIDGLTIKQR